jgi:hypothetical protein
MEIRLRTLYTLRDRTILRWVMQHPGRGVPYSVRELAAAANCSHSLVGHLLSGQRGACDMEVAHRIAESLGVAVLVLFAPSASPERTESTTSRTAA